jgi:hypothetical protein
MLHEQAVTATCLAIIKKIMAEKKFSAFRLAGGTALALKYGHRSSEDIGLFAEDEFDNQLLKYELVKLFGAENISQWRDMSFGVFCNICGIKSDFMFWGDGFIDIANFSDGIRLASDKDIFAMKLGAAFDRKSKKDFIDIALLSEKYGLEKGISWYKEKYPYNDELIPLKSLLHFEKADAEPDPEFYLHYNWKESKQIVINEVRKCIGA